MDSYMNAFLNGFIVGNAKGKASAPTGGGGAELNIHYGDTAPEDTSKLWVKTSEPSKVVIVDGSDGGTIRPNSITTSADVSTQLHSEGSAVVVNDKIYILGGGNNAGSTESYVLGIISFDPDNKKVEVLPCSLAKGAVNHGCAVVGTKVYVICGTKASTIQCFDVEAQTVTTVTTNITKTGPNCAVAVGTDIYIIGLGGNYVYSSKTVHCFNTLTNTYTTLPYSLPNSVSLISPSVVYRDGKILVSSKAQLFEIDVDNGTVVEKTNPTNLTTMYGSAWIGRKVCVFGYATSDSATGAISVSDYDTMENTVLSTTDLFGESCAFYGSVFVEYKGVLYIFYGSHNNNLTPTNIRKNVHEFRLAVTEVLLDNGTMKIKTTAEKNHFDLINTDTARVEIGVDAIYKGNADGIGDPVESALYKDGEWVTI